VGEEGACIFSGEAGSSVCVCVCVLCELCVCCLNCVCVCASVGRSCLQTVVRHMRA